MNAYDVMAGSPYLAFLLGFVMLCTVPHVMFRCWNRLLRHLSIRKHGWPPEHVDADGDFKRVKP